MRRLLFGMVSIVVGCSSQPTNDIVELKSGEQIEGSVRQATVSTIIVDTADQQRSTIERQNVRAIRFGSAPPKRGPSPNMTEALDAVKAIQTVTRVGIAYPDYADRTLDAQVKIDQKLSADDVDPKAKALVAEAMMLYVLAGRAWHAKVADNGYGRAQERYENVGRDPALELCPEAKRAANAPAPPNTQRTPDYNRGANLSFSFQTLWLCASERITRAENIIKSGG